MTTGVMISLQQALNILWLRCSALLKTETDMMPSLARYNWRLNNQAAVDKELRSGGCSLH